MRQRVCGGKLAGQTGGRARSGKRHEIKGITRLQLFSYRWYLAQSAVEVDTTELEFALMRAFEGFGRWQSECRASVCDLAATGSENAKLRIVRMNDRLK